MNFFDKIFDFILDLDKKGRKWIGIDGLLNMESSALVTLVLICFLPILWSMVFSLIIFVSKCLFDKSKGHEDEAHDCICATIGVIVGAIIGFVLMI
jgi:hypothetical protein